MADGDEEIPHGTPLTPEQEEMARLQEEVDKGVEATQLIDVSGSIYITFICSEAASIYWRPTLLPRKGRTEPPSRRRMPQTTAQV